MFQSLRDTADAIDCSEKKNVDLSSSTLADKNGKSSDFYDVEGDGAERPSTQNGIEKADEPPRTPRALTRTSSNVESTKTTFLSRVTSLMTKHHGIADPGPPPDGGLKAWTMVVMGWLAIFTTWGWINCFGVFQTYYTLTLKVSPSAISWIGTIQNFLTFFIGVFSGRLLDAGYFFPTALIGISLQLLAIFMMSLCTRYWQLFLTQGVLCGIGGGIFFTPCMGLLATYFSKRRAFAMAISSTGNSFGGMIYPILVRQLLPQIGFSWTVRVIGFLNLALLALVVAFMRPRLPARESSELFDAAAFREAPYTLFVIGLFFQLWCIYFTLYYISSFGVQIINFPFKKATELLIIVNGIGVPARLIPAYIADRFGPLNTIVPTGYLLTIVAWSWLAVHNVAGMYVFACVYGIIVAAFQCILPPTVASLTDDLSKIGTRLGMAFAFMGVSALTGPPIGGALIQAAGGSYVGAQAWSAGASTICAVVLTFARLARSNWQIKKRV